MAREGVAALLRCVAEARALLAVAASPSPVAYLVAGPSARQGGVRLLVRGQVWRVGPWHAHARLFRDVGRELGTGRAIERVRCGLCGGHGGDNLQAWAVAHPLTAAGLARGDV